MNNSSEASLLSHMIQLQHSLQLILKERSKTKPLESPRKVYWKPECPICLDWFISGDPICSLPCGHMFHQHCSKNFSSKCPICRQEFSSKT